MVQLIDQRLQKMPQFNREDSLAAPMVVVGQDHHRRPSSLVGLMVNNQPEKWEMELLDQSGGANYFD